MDEKRVHERRRSQPPTMCCLQEMRKLSVGPVSLFICDSCQVRRWMAGDQEVSPELALKIARGLDEVPLPPSPRSSC